MHKSSTKEDRTLKIQETMRLNKRKFSKQPMQLCSDSWVYVKYTVLELRAAWPNIQKGSRNMSPAT